MISFISPALGFKESTSQDNQTINDNTLEPVYIDKTLSIVKHLSSLNPNELQATLSCSDVLAELNFERYRDFKQNNTHQALRYFDGIAYKSLDVETLSSDEYDFLCKHIRILSGLYGILKPNDNISAYRLEMKTKIGIDGSKNLYDFWADSLYENLSKDSDKTIVNLASKEYSQCIENYLQDETYITCTFKVDKGKGLKVQSTAAKKARGQMVRWIAQNKIDDPLKLINFNDDGYNFDPTLSTTKGNRQELVFVKYSN